MFHKTSRKPLFVSKHGQSHIEARVGTRPPSNQEYPYYRLLFLYNQRTIQIFLQYKMCAPPKHYNAHIVNEKKSLVSTTGPQQLNRYIGE